MFICNLFHIETLWQWCIKSFNTSLFTGTKALTRTASL